MGPSMTLSREQKLRFLRGQLLNGQKGGGGGGGVSGSCTSITRYHPNGWLIQMPETMACGGIPQHKSPLKDGERPREASMYKTQSTARRSSRSRGKDQWGQGWPSTCMQGQPSALLQRVMTMGRLFPARNAHLWITFYFKCIGGSQQRKKFCGQIPL